MLNHEKSKFNAEAYIRKRIEEFNSYIVKNAYRHVLKNLLKSKSDNKK